jgi:hypothetical protein
MVFENPTWGASRIHGELLMLGCDVSERTISRWMRRAPRNPEPAKRWLSFLHNHREAIAAMDFFTVPTATFNLLYCFFIISHDRRRILHFNVTPHPTSSWIVQQMREAFPYQSSPRFLLFDHDQNAALLRRASAQYCCASMNPFKGFALNSKPSPSALTGNPWTELHSQQFFRTLSVDVCPNRGQRLFAPPSRSDIVRAYQPSDSAASDCRPPGARTIGTPKLSGHRHASRSEGCLAEISSVITSLFG